MANTCTNDFNYIILNLIYKMQPPRSEDNQRIITFYYNPIGLQANYVDDSGILLYYKQSLSLQTQLFLFNNFHFQHKGTRLSQTEPINKLFNQKQVKIDIVFHTYEYMTAQYHMARFMELVFTPQFYVLIHKDHFKEHLAQKINEKQPTPIFPIASIDFQNLQPDLNSPLLFSHSQVERKINLLTSIAVSGFNPAPTSAKLNGDLFYIYARTLQGQDIHITASPGGFFVNQSKISYFNPAKSVVYKGIYTNLFDLFKNVSEKFKQNLQKFVSQTIVTEAIKFKFSSYSKYSKRYWLDSAKQQHKWSQNKNIDEQLFSNTSTQLRDWNQIFQTQTQEQQSMEKDPIEGLSKLAKNYAMFQIAAVQGAKHIIDGKMSPLNPTDQKKKHIYIYNKIFFSIASQTVYDHSQEKGEDATPSSSAINTDLINIQILYNLGIQDLRVLHMIIINYRGYKVIAQCIIPGILSVDHMYCSQYGSIDDGKTIQNNTQFQKIMIEVCQKLGLQDNIQVIDGEGVKKRIAGSPDIKGILGSDKRKYILDLLRLSPRDLNYQGIENQTCVLRPELIKNYRASKSNSLPCKINVNIGTDIKFEKSQKYEDQQKLLKDMAAYLRKNAIQNLIDTLKNYPSQYLTNNDGIKRAFHYWGVNMRYLGQVCNHPSLKNEIQIKLVLQRVIAVRSIKHLLRMAMRQSNIMHLGATIINILNSIFGRKCHILYLEQGNIQLEQANEKHGDKDLKKKKKKKNKQANDQVQQIDMSLIINVIKIIPNKFIVMKPHEIWQEVRKIAQARFKYELSQSQLLFDVFKFPFQKIATLRDVCLSVGLVLEKKNYDMFDGRVSANSNQKTLPFHCKNIISIEPLTKKIKIEPPNLNERQKQHERLISNYQVKQALKLDTILQRENITICGGLNETAVKLFSRMGRILYILGQNKSAISQEQKNLNLLESLHSQDYWLNIQTHINLGLYYIAENDREKVVHYILKGIYLMLIAFGQTSPDLLVSFANLARIYQMNKEYKQSIQCYKTAMKFIQQIHGKSHVKMSFCLTALATISHQMNNLKSAIQYQTENVAVLVKILPDNDVKFQDALKILKMYRQMHQKSELQNSFSNFTRMMESVMGHEQQREKQTGKKKGKKN